VNAAKVEIRLGSHAVERFHERVRPALHLDAAELELGRLVAQGSVVADPPVWLAPRQRQFACCYVVVGDLVLPLEPDRRDREVLVALTCIARGGLSDRARQGRNARRRARAHRPVHV